MVVNCNTKQKHVRRARIVLLAGDRVVTEELHRRLGVSKPTIRRWRTRYVAGGIVEDMTAEDALGDEVLFGHERENVRLWTATLDDYAFSDVTVEVPEVTKAL